MLAEKRAPHVPAAWAAMAAHKQWAFICAGAFTVTAAWDRFSRGRRTVWVLLAWTAAVALLVVTAHWGATLVYVYGVGSPQS